MNKDSRWIFRSAPVASSKSIQQLGEMLVDNTEPERWLSASEASRLPEGITVLIYYRKRNRFEVQSYWRPDWFTEGHDNFDKNLFSEDALYKKLTPP